VSSPPIGDQRVHAELLQVGLDLLDAVRLLDGLVRDDPRIVPPRGSRPRTAGMSSGLVSASSGPRQPSRKPRKE
jgi:hypothetical protein